MSASRPPPEWEKALATPGGSGIPPRRGAKLAPACLLLSVLLFALAFVPSFAESWLPGRSLVRFLAAVSGFLAAYIGWVAQQQARMRSRLIEVLEEVLKAFYGPNFRRDREAVDILIEALDSEDASVREAARSHLERLTGQRLGADVEGWRAWWAEHRATYRRPTASGAPDPRGEPGEER